MLFSLCALLLYFFLQLLIRWVYYFFPFSEFDFFYCSAISWILICCWIIFMTECTVSFLYIFIAYSIYYLFVLFVYFFLNLSNVGCFVFLPFFFNFVNYYVLDALYKFIWYLSQFTSIPMLNILCLWVVGDVPVIS